MLRQYLVQSFCSFTPRGEKGIFVNISCIGKIVLLCCYTTLKHTTKMGFTRHRVKPINAFLGGGQKCFGKGVSQRLCTICDPQKLCSTAIFCVFNKHKLLWRKKCKMQNAKRWLGFGILFLFGLQWLVVWCLCIFVFCGFNVFVVLYCVFDKYANVLNMFVFCQPSDITLARLAEVQRRCGQKNHIQMS